MKPRPTDDFPIFNIREFWGTENNGKFSIWICFTRYSTACSWFKNQSQRGVSFWKNKSQTAPRERANRRTSIENRRKLIKITHEQLVRIFQTVFRSSRLFGIFEYSDVFHPWFNWLFVIESQYIVNILSIWTWAIAKKNKSQTTARELANRRESDEKRGKLGEMHSRAAARAVRMTRRATSRVRENMATEVGSGWRSKINDAEWVLHVGALGLMRTTSQHNPRYSYLSKFSSEFTMQAIYLANITMFWRIRGT